MKRIILIVMDSVGIGELPDAINYKDTGSNTLGNIAKAVKGFRLPNLEKLGLWNIDGMESLKSDEGGNGKEENNEYGKEKEGGFYSNPIGNYGKMAEKSKGKDTTTGHWEIAGLILENPFPTYPHGFPKEILDKFERGINKKVIGNIAASGTEIIKKLGDEHVQTRCPIVYTSADSVFQIAAHEDVIPIDKLYDMCQIARDILQGEHGVGRVIARPFNGSSGNYTRTDRRKDFSLEPIGNTMLDHLKNRGFEVKAVGKIEDIFNKRGITHAIHTHGNMDGIEKTISYMKEDFEGLIFTNLVDFDMLYGHRNDVGGYAKALGEFDDKIPSILKELREEDILIITADHGCDPTTVSTDHSREYVPVIVYGNKLKTNVNLGVRETFADIGATVLDYFGVVEPVKGKSFLNLVEK